MLGALMFKRQLEKKLEQAVASFPVVVLTGPRQSGKTTLLRQQFPNLTYVSLESPDVLLFAQSDPRGFLDQHQKTNGLMIDEAQNLPELFSYIQEYVDLHGYPGMFILSGSQSLAGRSAVLELLPLSYSEFMSDENKTPDLWEYLFKGSYPRPYHENLDRNLWWQSYLKTYVERDVRQIINIRDLSTFQRFLKMCAARHGQLLNLSSLAVDVGVSQSTAKEWVSLLESSYLVYRLMPHHRNFNKRLVKTPKLYFYDSGLVCHLLGIDSAEYLALHSMRGAIFEGFIISELAKYFFQQAKTPPIYFWRDQQGREIDCLIERGEDLIGLEIKSGKTMTKDFFKGLLSWGKMSGQDHLHLIYAGEKSISIHGVAVHGWRSFEGVFS